MTTDIWAVRPDGTRKLGFLKSLATKKGEGEVKGTVFCSELSAEGKVSMLDVGSANEFAASRELFSCIIAFGTQGGSLAVPCL